MLVLFSSVVAKISSVLAIFSSALVKKLSVVAIFYLQVLMKKIICVGVIFITADENIIYGGKNVICVG